MVQFFTPQEEALLVEAIRLAELDTSGEIRVHIESEMQEDILMDAQQVFIRLHMDRTKDRNGVLIYLIPTEKQFAIIGDIGIHGKVGSEFWSASRLKLEEAFRSGNYCSGLVSTIQEIGKQLKKHFPWQRNDINELPDTISYD